MWDSLCSSVGISAKVSFKMSSRQGRRERESFVKILRAALSVYKTIQSEFQLYPVTSACKCSAEEKVEGADFDFL